MKNINQYYLKADLSWTNDSYSISNTPSINIITNFLYIEEIGHFKTLPSYYTEREGSNTFLLILTILGKGYLKYLDKEYTVSKNDVFFINCEDYQFYKNASNDIWEFIFIHFNGIGCKQYFDYFIKSNVSPVVSLQESKKLEGILEELKKTVKQKNTKAEIYNSCLITEVLTQILLAGCNIAKNEHLLFAPEYIKGMTDYLDKHFNEPVTLDLLCHNFAISKFHLSREFKRHTGISFKEYLINLRITRAKELLKSTDLPISQIAENIGIENVTHFINLFKNRENCTPLKYKKLWN
jgi:AraC-like DNA-binding protein